MYECVRMHVHARLFQFLFIYLYICLSVYLSLCLSICFFIYSIIFVVAYFTGEIAMKLLCDCLIKFLSAQLDEDLHILSQLLRIGAKQRRLNVN